MDSKKTVIIIEKRWRHTKKEGDISFTGRVAMENYFNISISKHKEWERSTIFFVVADIVFITVVVY